MKLDKKDVNHKPPVRVLPGMADMPLETWAGAGGICGPRTLKEKKLKHFKYVDFYLLVLHQAWRGHSVAARCSAGLGLISPGSAPSSPPPTFGSCL